MTTKAGGKKTPAKMVETLW